MTERPGRGHSVVLMSQDAGLPAVTRDTHSSRASLQASVGGSLCFGNVVQVWRPAWEPEAGASLARISRRKPQC